MCKVHIQHCFAYLVPVISSPNAQSWEYFSVTHELITTVHTFNLVPFDISNSVQKTAKE